MRMGSRSKGVGSFEEPVALSAQQKCVGIMSFVAFGASFGAFVLLCASIQQTYQSTNLVILTLTSVISFFLSPLAILVHLVPAGRFADVLRNNTRGCFCKILRGLLARFRYYPLIALSVGNNLVTFVVALEEASALNGCNDVSGKTCDKPRAAAILCILYSSACIVALLALMIRKKRKAEGYRTISKTSNLESIIPPSYSSSQVMEEGDSKILTHETGVEPESDRIITLRAIDII